MILFDAILPIATLLIVLASAAPPSSSSSASSSILSSSSSLNSSASTNTSASSTPSPSVHTATNYIEANVTSSGIATHTSVVVWTESASTITPVTSASPLPGTPPKMKV
ncbi:hypothetical protein JAAARDRAFT_206114 [Jaapia argillacea MUCL 33604]|uniref:REJ domain-containing protein n=1 Tax=Jaapia argillacea MUCL 33604 TaxID=933084 RepID=A0A067Q981_9AGAM|nr:hypothetical protein JAAARDRAFT_206114 [Jaapia argillacea MUCL 33604]